MAQKYKTHSKNGSYKKPAVKTADSKEASKQKKAEEGFSDWMSLFNLSGIGKQDYKTPEDKLNDYNFMKGPIPTTDKKFVSTQHFELTYIEKQKLTEKQIKDFEAIQNAYEQGWKNWGLTGACMDRTNPAYAASANFVVTLGGLHTWAKDKWKNHDLNRSPLDYMYSNDGCTGCWNSQLLTIGFIRSVLPKDSDWEFIDYDMYAHHTVIVKLKKLPVSEGYVFDPWFTQSPDIYRYEDYRQMYPISTLGGK